MAEGIGLTQDVFSGFRPADFGTCRAWFKADSLSLNDGDAVTTWADQSGNSRDLSQGTGANKPLFKKGVAGGSPALLFDGSNDYMSTASFTARAHPVTIYVVAKRLSGTNQQTLVDGIAASNSMTVFTQNTTGKPSIYSGAGLTGQYDIGADWFLVTAVFDTTNSTITLNDIFQIKGDSSNQTLTGIRVGADSTPAGYWNGYIAEVIYFDGSLTFDNNLAVKKYLMAKYSISYLSLAGITGFRSMFAADHVSGLRDGDAIASWNDVGPAAINCAQSDSSKRPLWKRDIYNHRPCVRFDGSNDFLRSASFTELSQQCSVFVVGKHNNATTDDFFFAGIDSSKSHLVYTFNTTGFVGMHAGTDLNSSTDVGTSLVLLTAIFNGGSSALYKNSASIASGSAGTQKLTGYTIGARHDDASPLNGDICELLVFEGALSSTNQKKVDGYLIAKYGL